MKGGDKSNVKEDSYRIYRVLFNTELDRKDNLARGRLEKKINRRKWAGLVKLQKLEASSQNKRYHRVGGD